MTAARIDSPANPRIAAAAGLRERRERDRTGLTLVDGAREAMRAIEAGVALETAFLAPELLGDDAAPAVEWLAAHAPERIVEIGSRPYAKLAYGDRSDGIVLVVRPTPRRLEDLAVGHARLGPDPLVVVTEDVEKPGNLGAILRSADGAGAGAVVAIGGTDLYNPNVIRASVGTVFRLPIAAASVAETLAWSRREGLRVVASRVDAPLLHVDADLRGPLMIVVGSEARGLSAGWDEPGIETVRLPMEGLSDSLNVSVATGILLYEAWRQRHAPLGRRIEA